jgi:hypothetical protein
MRDEVPSELDPGSRLGVTIDPVWTTADDDPPVTGGNGKVLALRDPGYGWLAFFFPDKEAAAIAGWLTKDQGKCAYLAAGLPAERPALRLVGIQQVDNRHIAPRNEPDVNLHLGSLAWYGFERAGILLHYV